MTNATPPAKLPTGFGLALGSGAARGLAHIGLLRVLEQEGLRPAAVAGTSIGALIAALYAAGVPTDDMVDVALGVDWRQLGRLIRPSLPTSGLVDSERLDRFFAELLPVRAFSELNLPVVMTATDIETGESVMLRQGELLPALRAAVAFPGIFPAVPVQGRFLVDGGLCHPVPVAPLRELGCSRVVGMCTIPEVDKASHEAFVPSPRPRRSRPRSPLFGLIRAERVERLWQEIWGRNGQERKSPDERKPPNLFRVFAQSVAIMENQINSLRLASDGIDLLLRPTFVGINMFEFHRAEEIIAIGEQAGRAALAEIRTLAEAP
ncbi:MAG: patatin-like phospholipase RssA [Geothermobacteraceae bacterium]